ncbi:hypothetical protein [Streptomyces sp. NPDC046821]|uniref:hypothetical protein n=1 Tax=Streptomyces sp. NPDC046821 TaxID=3154702 RepID=UPI0033C03D76
MSYNQPGPYGGQQPQQPGPYGQPQQPGPYGQPQQPGPYGQPPQAPQPGYGYPQQPPQGVPPQQPPYGQPGGYSQPQQPGPYGQQPQAPYGQAPYGQMPPPPGAPAGGKNKTGLIIGAVAVVAALGVGAYLLFGGNSLADDGPHKLITPAVVMGDYKRLTDDKGPQEASSGSAKALAESGVTNAKAVNAIYSTLNINPAAPKPPSPAEVATSKAVTFVGIYGKVKDPEAAIDATFANMKKQQADQPADPSKPKLTYKGDPQTVEPDGLDGAIMKCQQASAKNAQTHQIDTQYMCLWADYSTIGMGVPVAGGKGISLDDSAKVTANLRKEVRVAE